MDMVTLTSASLSQSFPFQTNTKDTDASFSSYLSNAEEAFIRKLGKSSRKLSPVNIIPTTQEDSENLRRKKEQDEEIGVFGAEKYFNGVIDQESPRIASDIGSARKYHYTKDEQANSDQMKTKIQSETPSVRSESSWNSQSVLLQSRMIRNPYRKKKNHKMINGKNFFSTLGCNYCSCSDKNAIDINEDVGEISFKKSNNNNNNANFGLVHGKSSTVSPIKTTSLNHVDSHAVQINKSSPILDTRIKEEMMNMNSKRLDREPCFSFPSSKHGVGNNNFPAAKIQFQEDHDQDKLRKSLEVFGSPLMEKGNRSLSLERRLTMLSWDITPRVAEEIEFNPNSATIYHDSESDASSDLFEIESLTGKTNSNPFLTRIPSDDTSGCVTPTTCYAPSEASIEWSVVTASAADVSIMSDCEEQRSAIHMSSPMKTTAVAIPDNIAKTNAINKEIQRRRPSNILLGCKSHKAVRVAGDAYRTNDHNKTFYHVDHHVRRRSDSNISMTRFQAENNLMDFGPRLGQHVLPTHSLPRLQSPRNSHLLYIQ